MLQTCSDSQIYNMWTPQIPLREEMSRVIEVLISIYVRKCFLKTKMYVNSAESLDGGDPSCDKSSEFHSRPWKFSRKEKYTIHATDLQW